MSSRTCAALLAPLALFAVAALAQTTPPKSAAPTAEQAAFFEQSVRPVLLAQCVSCHNAAAASGGIRLDSADGVRAAFSTTGKGFPERFVHAIRYDSAVKMPPTRKMRDTEIAALTAWIQMGAPWPAASSKPANGVHWSFIAPKKPLEPPVEKSGIDAFVLAKLETAKLTPAPLADKRTLLRRVTFDLIGVPPTPKEMDTFLADASPTAYERAVDRLLADPRFGERWARHWLDLARYADSNGLDENLAFGYAWRYRDWVVDAMNRDLPYDQFLSQQLAGDLMPTSDEAERNRRLTATGYLTLGAKVLAEQDKPKLVMDIVDEQIDVVTKSTMGLTVACARCHDHKFDPISTKDYYALAGIFKSTKTMANLDFVSRWNERPLETRAQASALASFEASLVPLKKALETARREVDASTPAGSVFVDAAKFVRGNVNVGGYGDGVINTKESPTFAEWEVNVATAGKWRIEMRRAAEEDRPARLLVNGKLLSGKAGVGTTGGWTPEFQGWISVGALELPAGKAVLRLERDGPIPHISRLVLLPDSAPSIANSDSKIKAAADALKAADAKRPETPMAMAVTDGKLEDVKVHIRGDTQNLGDTVKRGFPAVLCGGTRMEVAASDGSGRLAFAHWLTRPEHPLTARVAVNRIWQSMFGIGIVRTADNFGIMGEKPSNQPLLDYLAVTFVEDDRWSVKKLIRRIALTDAYRRASVVSDPAAARVDPDNRLLWRQNRRRLEAEPLRDSLLAVAGTLDSTIGGTLMSTKDGDYVTNDQSADRGFYGAPRRSLYLPVIRNALFDYFLAFDVGDPTLVNAGRASTIVAPQALFLMNSPLAREQSAAFAKRVLATSGSDNGRITAAYALAYQRTPFPAEVSRDQAFLARIDTLLAGKGIAPEKRQSERWAAYCQVLLASNEFVYVE